jgi:hypothetical protein
LFPESFGTVLVEVEPYMAEEIFEVAFEDALLVGHITPEKGITVSGKRLNLSRLFESWNTRFEEEVYDV